MSEAPTIPDEIAKRTARLINEAEDMRAQAVDDLKTIYGDLREELKALGWAGQNVSKEVAALKGAIAEIRLDEEKRAKREEKGDRVDDYVSILSKSPARARARVRENIEKFDPDTGEILDGSVDAKLVQTIAAGVQTETGRKALIAAVDIMIEREEAEERRSDGGLDIITKHTEIATNEGGANQDSVDMAQGSVPDLEPSGPEAERAQNSPETAHESPRKAAEAVSERTATQVDADASAEATIEGQPSVIVATSAESATAVERNAEATVEQRSTATILTAKPPSPLRPHCQRPENCGGYGRTHCGVCLRAKEREMA